MKKYQTLGMGAVVAAAAFSLFTLTANAQQPPAAAPAAPGTVAPVKPATPPAAAKAPAATTPAVTAAKKPAAASPCKGLDEVTCKANKACDYVVPTAVNAKTGKVPAAYCRKVAGVAAKKPATAPAATTPAPANAAPAKPAVKPTAPAPTTKQ